MASVLSIARLNWTETLRIRGGGNSLRSTRQRTTARGLAVGEHEDGLGTADRCGHFAHGEHVVALHVQPLQRFRRSVRVVLHRELVSQDRQRREHEHSSLRVRVVVILKELEHEHRKLLRRDGADERDHFVPAPRRRAEAKLPHALEVLEQIGHLHGDVREEDQHEQDGESASELVRRRKVA
eukprot:4216765-Prymnesium_polylepis.1